MDDAAHAIHFRHSHWWRHPSIHSNQIDEVFFRAMAVHYGMGWPSWMPELVVLEHWRRFPDHFGNGPEALFLAWMNARYGAGWQQWLPTPIVRMNWLLLFGR